jgi:hypothetical protein
MTLLLQNFIKINKNTMIEKIIVITGIFLIVGVIVFKTIKSLTK